MEEKTYTISQAQLYFAVDFHTKTWELLDKHDRTVEDNERMIGYAYASLAHWRTAGTAARHQRGEWMLARVYSALGDGKQASQHAYRCAEIIQGNPDEMSDFDFAFAFEAIARAHAVLGERAEAERFVRKAREAGEKIKEGEDRTTFFAELKGGEWHGVKVE